METTTNQGGVTNRCICVNGVYPGCPVHSTGPATLTAGDTVRTNDGLVGQVVRVRRGRYVVRCTDKERAYARRDLTVVARPNPADFDLGDNAAAPTANRGANIAAKLAAVEETTPDKLRRMAVAVRGLPTLAPWALALADEATVLAGLWPHFKDTPAAHHARDLAAANLIAGLDNALSPIGKP